MATHKVPAGEVGVYEVPLTANTVDTVEFASNLAAVEIVSDGAAALYVTVDGGAPTVKGAHCYFLPAGATGVRTIKSKVNQPTVVELISAGAPTFSVARPSD